MQKGKQNPLNKWFKKSFEKRIIIKYGNCFNFFSHQVSHHPPISACHAESDNFVFWQGNSLFYHLIPIFRICKESMRSIEADVRAAIYVLSVSKHVHFKVLCEMLTGNYSEILVEYF